MTWLPRSPGRDTGSTGPVREGAQGGCGQVRGFRRPSFGRRRGPQRDSDLVPSLDLLANRTTPSTGKSLTRPVGRRVDAGPQPAAAADIDPQCPSGC